MLGSAQPAKLPKFMYHPDPISTSSIKPSTRTCAACGQARGYIYTILAYSEEDLDDALCPWCIADGTAHDKFDAEFVDRSCIGLGYGAEWDAVPESVVEEVACRTPCFAGRQQERWFTHCGDAAEFVAVAGREDLERFGPKTVAAIAGETGLEGEELGC